MHSYMLPTITIHCVFSLGNAWYSIRSRVQSSSYLRMDSWLTNFSKNDRRALALGGFLICISFIYIQLTNNRSPEKATEKEEEKKEEIELKDFTVEQLVRLRLISRLHSDSKLDWHGRTNRIFIQQRNFDGKGEQPIYIALKGDVFDVSSAREFYGEGSG